MNALWKCPQGHHWQGPIDEPGRCPQCGNSDAILLTSHATSIAGSDLGKNTLPPQFAQWLGAGLAALDQERCAIAGEPAGDDAVSNVSANGMSPECPRQLGEYELLELIGGGGMGEVWKGRHRKLDKLVAVKVLPTGQLHAPEIVARFLREMKALGRLDHPNIVEAHDAGEHDGTVYLVMKLVPGQDLSRLVKEGGPLPIAEACELARQTALGLQYLHDQRLVHRDIKPSNLMLTPDGTVKILDLGLARWRGESHEGEELTAAGQVLGTPAFMAPEQIDRAAGADMQADLYALGGTLFHLLTGKTPFAGHSSTFDKLLAHCSAPAPDVRSLRPDVPEDLAVLISRLLAKDPKDRPGAPAEVATALEALACTLLEGRQGSPANAPSPARSRRFRMVALATAATLLLIGTALLLPRWFETPAPTPDRGEMHLAAKSAAAFIAEAQTLDLKPPGLRNEAAIIAAYSQALQHDPDSWRAYLGRGTAYDNLERFDEALADYNEGLRRAPPAADVYLIHEQRGKLFHNRAAFRTHDPADWKRAMEDHAAAIKFRPEKAVNYKNRAICQAHLGIQSGAIADYTVYLKFYPNDFLALLWRADAYQNNGDLVRARIDREQALRINPAIAPELNERFPELKAAPPSPVSAPKS